MTPLREVHVCVSVCGGPPGGFHFCLCVRASCNPSDHTPHTAPVTAASTSQEAAEIHTHVKLITYDYGNLARSKRQL